MSYKKTMKMEFPEIYSASGLMELIQQIGFLPLLDSGIAGFSAEEIVDEDCGYVALPEGGWEWPLWKWKGEIVTGMPCMYGKFFNKKAGFISKAWWPDFCNYRRSKYPYPADGSIEEAILSMLHSTGSLITREFRSACGFNGKGMRSKFDRFGKNIMLVPFDKGHFTVTVSVAVSPRFFGWLCGFGEKVEIIAPDKVVDEMREFVNGICRLYN